MVADQSQLNADDHNVCVVGGGYVGLVTAAWLAETNRNVKIVETDSEKLEQIRLGTSPIYEPGLNELLQKVVVDHKLSATDQIAEGLRGAGIVIVAVGTPPMEDGSADLRQVRSVVTSVAKLVPPETILVIKSTVPPGSANSLRELARRYENSLAVVSCPEFLREGSALTDCRNPARVVIGGDDRVAIERVAKLFAHLDCNIFTTDYTSAEMIKYGTNAFLAAKISFINELAQLCELTGGDVEHVADGLGLDPRIGRAFMNAGLGYGGSCFPKDVQALSETADLHGQSFRLVEASIKVNNLQRKRFVEKIRTVFNGQLEGCKIGVLGLAFKPGTDDMRQAASLEIIRQLHGYGAEVTATDPVATNNAKSLLSPAIILTDDPYLCLMDADAVVLVTEWKQFLDLSWNKIAQNLRQKVIFDGRNVLDGDELVKLGFSYHSIGRATRTPIT